MAKRNKGPDSGSGAAFERVELTDLRPDDRNARKHDERNITAVMQSLARFGQQKPIVVSADGKVIAGNATLEAARRLKWTHLTVVRTTLEPMEAMAYAIADNRTAELAEWDDKELQKQLEEMAQSGLDPSFLDFDAEQIERWQEDVKRNDDLYEAVEDPVLEDESPEHGSKWRLDESLLLVMHPVDDVDQWRSHLDGIELFVPFPSCHAVVADKFVARRCLFVQPIRQAAAYLIRTARKAGMEVERLA